MSGLVKRWTGHSFAVHPEETRTQRVSNETAYAPPSTIWQAVAPMAEMLAVHRAAGVPLLGKRQARQWLKELGARRRAHQEATR